MSYNFGRENLSSYSDSNNMVNTVGDYYALGNYYQKSSCPQNSTPGTCVLQPLTIHPSWGGVAYSIPGFNSYKDISVPLGDSNYFNLNTAYPQNCKQSLYEPTYSKN